MNISGLDDLFFFVVFTYLFLGRKMDIRGTYFWAEKWTSANRMTLKESVLLLRSENMVTLG